MAQIHALLFLSEAPLTAETIAEVLRVARSNVSTSIRELQSWGLVKMVHVEGDRRDHFEAHRDVRDIFRVVIEERKKRDQPVVGGLLMCAVLILMLSAYAAEWGHVGVILMALLSTALFIFRDLRPDLMRELTRPSNRPPGMPPRDSL